MAAKTVKISIDADLLRRTSSSRMGPVPAGLLPQAPACPVACRPRHPRANSLYQLLDTHFETLKRVWEERFEPRYGVFMCALSKRWSELIYRIYEVDPLDCPRCGARMKILGLVTEPDFIRRILEHLDKTTGTRAPPGSTRLH